MIREELTPEQRNNLAPIHGTARDGFVRGFGPSMMERKPDRQFYVMAGDAQVWELDGYVQRDPVNQREHWCIVLACPKCTQNLKLDSTKKPIEISDRGLEVAELIRCSYPGDFGTLCGWQAHLVPTREVITMRDRQTNAPIKVRLDAKIRR